MSGKKILIATNRVPYPLTDGGNIAMNMMIEGYHNAGWQVYLLSMNTSRHYVEAEWLSKIYTHIHAFETVDVDNRIRLMPTLINYFFSRKPNHVARFTDEAYADKLFDVISSFKPDVIQVESVFLSEYLPAIKSVSKAVTVLRLHNLEHKIWEMLADSAGNFIKKNYLRNLSVRIRRYERRVWKGYDLLLPITVKDCNVVKKTSSEKRVLVIPYAIDMDKLPPDNSGKTWNAYHIGAMDWIPNADGIRWFLNNAWKKIAHQIPDFKFFFAGRNMPGYFKNLGLKNVICEGEVPDASAFISDKKILIVPVKSASGIRVKTLEAMAAGKLVISTNIGMQGIEAIAGVHYLAANDARDFIHSVKWALMYREEAEQICENARELVRAKYDREQLMSRLFNRIDNILADKPLSAKA